MKDGFGLMHLHKFLSIPFLQLQVGGREEGREREGGREGGREEGGRGEGGREGRGREGGREDDMTIHAHTQQETLLHQLKVNREQMLEASEELNTAVQSEDQNYDL